MSYDVTHLSGEMETGFPLERFGELLDQLESADGEHTDVSVAHESDWSLSVFHSGYLVFQNLEEGGTRHMGPVDRDVALELMQRLASGQVLEIRELDGWRAGYPPRG